MPRSPVEIAVMRRAGRVVAEMHAACREACWPGTPGPRLRVGHVFAVEPMVTAGSADTVLDDDGWTVRTADGGLAAHAEHTIAVTEHGPEILTGP